MPETSLDFLFKEKESNFTPAQLAELKEYFRRREGLYAIESGHLTIGHGTAEYALTTDAGQGIHIYEQGNMKIGSNLTMEIITGFDGDTKTTKLLIKNMNGDVHIEAPNGDVVLQGKSVQIHANDAKGVVQLNSARNIDFRSPSVSANSDHVEINAAMSANTVSAYTTTYGHNSCDIGDGPTDLVDGTLLQKIINAIEKIKIFFKSICIG